LQRDCSFAFRRLSAADRSRFFVGLAQARLGDTVSTGGLGRIESAVGKTEEALCIFRVVRIRRDAAAGLQQAIGPRDARSDELGSLLP